MLLYRNLKKSFVTFISLLIVFSSNSFASNSLTESAIKVEVEAKLASDPIIPKNQIVVRVNSDVVKLVGVVDTTIQAEKAIELAMSVDGVSDVDDSDLKLSEDKSLLQSVVLTAKVKGRLVYLATYARIARDYDIQVETKNKQVYLKGYVASEGDKDTILKEIKKIKGIKSLQSDIRVR